MRDLGCNPLRGEEQQGSFRLGGCLFGNESKRVYKQEKIKLKSRTPSHELKAAARAQTVGEMTTRAMVLRRDEYRRQRPRRTGAAQYPSGRLVDEVAVLGTAEWADEKKELQDQARRLETDFDNLSITHAFLGSQALAGVQLARGWANAAKK